jgi:DNA-binding transcriptional regulator YhcF (GntR family)
MHQFNLDQNTKLLTLQIGESVIRDIEKGILAKGARLPSINAFSEQYGVARDTVERAYRELKAQGYITAVAAKGYYVTGKKETKIKVLLVFNKLSSYKKIVYDSIVQTLGDAARVDLHIHHYNPQLFREIMENNAGRYHYYMIMPHFFHQAEKKEWLNIIKMIPENELLLIDKNVPELGEQHMAVYQDFKHDIYNALLSALDLLHKYQRIVIVFQNHTNKKQ